MLQCNIKKTTVEFMQVESANISATPSKDSHFLELV